MGVEFYACDSCGSTFADCGDFVSCGDDCRKRWCDNDCAEDDGHTYAKCKLGLEISNEGYLKDDRSVCPKYCDSDERWCDCDGCENYTPTSCKYCRNEDYEDSELLVYALEALDMTRSDLIEAINLEKEELNKKHLLMK